MPACTADEIVISSEGLLVRPTRPFAPRGSTEEVEEGRAFAPKFDADGLVTCVATDARSGDVLMVAHMNAEALRRPSKAARPGTSAARARRFGARARAPATSSASSRCASTATRTRSGSRSSRGPGACHTGRRSCFYRAVPLGKTGAVTLEFRDADKAFDPKAVYGINRDRLVDPHAPWRAPALLGAREMRPVVHHAVDRDRARAGSGREGRDDRARLGDRLARSA